MQYLFSSKVVCFETMIFASYCQSRSVLILERTFSFKRVFVWTKKILMALLNILGLYSRERKTVDLKCVSAKN